MRKNGKTNAVGRAGALLRPAGYTELSKIFGESVCTYPLGRRGRCPHRPGRMHRFYGNLRRICNFSMADRVVSLTTTLRTLCRGGRLCPPAGCTDFTGIFGEFTATPYIQRGNCLRIRRKFSKEFTAFCRAEQSPAPTNCSCISTVFCVKQTVYGLKLMTLPTGEGVGVRIRRNFSKKFTAFRRADKSSASTNSIRISVALCVSLTHFGLNLSQSRSPAQFLPQRRSLFASGVSGTAAPDRRSCFSFCRNAAAPQSCRPCSRIHSSCSSPKAAQTKRRLFSSAQSVFFLLCSRRCSGAFRPEAAPRQMPPRPIARQARRPIASETPSPAVRLRRTARRIPGGSEAPRGGFPAAFSARAA